MPRKHTQKPHLRPKASIDLLKVLKTSPTKIPKVAKEAATGAPPPLEWRRLMVVAGIIALVVVGAYVNTLWGKMVFNDASMLAFLKTLHSNSDLFWNGLWLQAITSPLSQQWLKATYAWDFQTAGQNLMWYHAVNIGLHLVTCWYFAGLIFLVSWSLKNKGRLSVDPYHFTLVSTVLFACHPLACESVAYISGRVAPLAGANYFLALDCFLLGYLGRNGTVRFWGYFLALLALFVGLTVSPDVLTVPLIALALTIILKDPGVSWLKFVGARGSVLAAIVLLLGSLPYLALRGVMLQSGNGFGLATLAPGSYWSMQLKGIFVYYLRCFLVPLGLSVDPPVRIASSWTDPWVVVGGCVMVLALAGLWLARRQPIVLLGILLFLVGFVPASIIVQPEVLADHRFYLSMSGLCVLVGWLLARLYIKSARVAVALCATIVVLFIGLTIWRNFDWSNNLRLWQSTVRVNPSSARARAMLAMELIRQGKATEAAKSAKQAVSLDPKVVPAFLAVGYVLLAEKDYKGASDAFGHALKLAEEQRLGQDIVLSARSGLAQGYLGVGDWERAHGVAQAALVDDPDNARLHMILGKSLVKLKKYPRGLLELRTAINLDQSLSECWQPLVEAGIELRLPEVARPAAVMLAKYDTSLAAKILVARAEIVGGDYVLAKEILATLTKQDPKNVEVLILLAWVEDKLGNKDAFQRHHNAALKLDPQAYLKVTLPLSNSPLPRVQVDKEPIEQPRH